MTFMSGESPHPSNCHVPSVLRAAISRQQCVSALISLFQQEACSDLPLTSANCRACAPVPPSSDLEMDRGRDADKSVNSAQSHGFASGNTPHADTMPVCPAVFDSPLTLQADHHPFLHSVSVPPLGPGPPEAHSRELSLSSASTHGSGYPEHVLSDSDKVRR